MTPRTAFRSEFHESGAFAGQLWRLRKQRDWAHLGSSVALIREQHGGRKDALASKKQFSQCIPRRPLN